MPITPILIKNLGKPFIVVPAYFTLAEVHNLIEESTAHTPTETFIVVPIPDGYRSASFKALTNQIGLSDTQEKPNTAFYTRPLLDYAIPEAHIRSTDTSESSRQIRQWLAQHPNDILLVTEANRVVAVFSNLLLFAHHTESPSRVYLPQEPLLFPPPPQNIQFTSFYPQQAEAGVRYGIFVYAHLTTDLANVLSDVTNFESQLSAVPHQKTTESTFAIKNQARITVRLESDVIGFLPGTPITQSWQGKWLRFAFAFTMPTTVEVLPVRAVIAIEHIEKASIAFTINKISPTNPLRQAELAELDGLQHAVSYRNIFVSYSRKDTTVIRAFRAFQEMTGDKILLDTATLRPGEAWQAGLARMINQADVFMLFWSKHSAASQHVKDEWLYALQYRCPKTACIQYIRPVYWEQPLIPLPSELTHLNAYYSPLKHTLLPSQPSTTLTTSYKELIATQQAICEIPEMAQALQIRYMALNTEFDKLAPPRKFDIGRAAYELYDTLQKTPIDWAQHAADLLDGLTDVMRTTAPPTQSDLASCGVAIATAPPSVQLAFTNLLSLF